MAAFVYFGIACGVLAGLSLLGKSLFRSVDRAYAARAHSQTHLHEALRSPLLVRSLDLSTYLHRRWSAAYEHAVVLFRKADYLSGVASALFELIHQAAPLLILAWKLPEVARGSLSFGTAFALSTVFAMGFDPFLKIAALLAQIPKAVQSYRSLSAILALDEEPALEGEREVAGNAGALDIKLEKVSFRFPTGSPEPVLREVDFEARPGERIAIVGSSGAGKSTLMQLLIRLYDASQGAIKIDGVPIANFPPATLRRWIGIVSQDTELFSGTILENLAPGDPNPNRARAERVCYARQRAGVHRRPSGSL